MSYVLAIVTDSHSSGTCTLYYLCTIMVILTVHFSLSYS